MSNAVPPNGSQASPFYGAVGQMGREISGLLSQALERIDLFAGTGRIDRATLHQLRHEVEAARQVGMLAQQLDRLASGAIRSAPEEISVTQLLRDALVERHAETQARGLLLEQAMQPTEVVADVTLLHTLVQSLMAWAYGYADGRIAIRLESPDAQVRLTCRISRPAPPDGGEVATPADVSLDSVAWRLLRQVASLLGVDLHREDSDTSSLLAVDLTPLAIQQQAAMTVVELEDDYPSSQHSNPLAGSKILVIVSRRALRNEVRDAIYSMGMAVDFVTSIDEAFAFCLDATPDAVVYESALSGQRFEQLRAELLRLNAEVALVEIAEEGEDFTLSDQNVPQARIGREALSRLPAALLFELTRSHAV